MLKNNYMNNTKTCKHEINRETNEDNLKLVKNITCERDREITGQIHV